MTRPVAAMLVVLLGACGAAPPADEGSREAGPFDGTPYGEAIALTTLTHIAFIVDDPESFVGDTVLVEGLVTDVCDRMGCWMDLVDDVEGRKIQVKVDDGVIVFPESASGHRARVEGIVEKVERTEEEAIAAARHHAEERGLEFDPASVSGPETIYRIRALGALIAEPGPAL
jgi:hypothetical protein